MAPPRSPKAPRTLTPAVFHILLALSEGPLHGYAISQHVESASEGRVRMGPGTLYGSIQRMQQSGLVGECDPPDDGGPHGERRRYYELTEAGSDALRAEAGRIEKLTDLAAFRAVMDRR
ncbi:MAG: PadR family transcriptional regulator [Acidobacteriota bacterium]